MLLNVKSLMKSRVEAIDGEVGKVVDIFFDDQQWVARYVVVETGTWLKSKRVLVSPASVTREKGEIGVLHANLSRDQITQGPDIDTDQPVSRQYEAVHAMHYGYRGYWEGPQLWGLFAYPEAAAAAYVPELLPQADREAIRRKLDEAQRSHLRSCKEVLGYRVEARDGDAGDIDDLAIDDETWAIRHLVVDTKRWWPGGQVLVATPIIEGVFYDKKTVTLRAAREVALAQATRE